MTNALKFRRRPTDSVFVATCRICGVTCGDEELLPVHVGGGCRSCNGSPACARCGHPRRQHRGTFGGGAPGCKSRVNAEFGLSVGRCGCVGYTTEKAAFAEPIPIVELTHLRLRESGGAPTVDAPRLAPVRDMLDEGRRLRDLSELDGLPWRPPR